MHPTRVLMGLAALLIDIAAQGNNPATLGASIKSQAAYSLLPGCVNQCLWDIGDNDTPDIGGDLAIHLSCASPWINGCYCRGASAAVAYSFITSCASYLCTTPAASDINGGVNVYTSYCSQALGAAYKPEAIPQSAQEPTAAAVSTSVIGAAPPATAGLSSSVPKQTGGPSGPLNPGATASASSNSNKNDDRIAGLSRGAFIGVVVSASCSVLGLLFGICFKIYKHKKHVRMQEQQIATSVYYQPKA